MSKLNYNRSIATGIALLRPDLASRDALRRKLQRLFCYSDVYFATIVKDIRDIIMNYLPELRVRDIQSIIDQAHTNRSNVMSHLHSGEMDEILEAIDHNTSYILCDSVEVVPAAGKCAQRCINSYAILTALIAHDRLTMNQIYTYDHELHKYVDAVVCLANPAKDLTKTQIKINGAYCVCVLPCGLICFRKISDNVRRGCRFYLCDPQTQKCIKIGNVCLKINECVNDFGEIIATNVEDLLSSTLSPLFCGIPYEKTVYIRR